MWLPSDFRVQKLLVFHVLNDWSLHISIFHLLFNGKLKSIPNSHHSSPYGRDGTAYDSDASALFVQVFQNLFPAFHKTVTKALLGCFLLLFKTHMRRWGEKKHKTFDVETLFFLRRTWRHGQVVIPTCRCYNTWKVETWEGSEIPTGRLMIDLPIESDMFVDLCWICWTWRMAVL